MRRDTPGIALRMAMAPLFIGIAGGLAAQAAAPPLTFEEKLAILGEELNRSVPRDGRWVVAYRERGRPAGEATVLWDSGQPTPYAANPSAVPSWLPLILAVRVEGLVDGHGRPFSGPLVAHVSEGAQIGGPYPEGFVCAFNGEADFVVEPTFEPFTMATVSLSVAYRPMPVYVVIGGRPWPETPDYWLGPAMEERPMWAHAVSFAGHEHSANGFRMSPVTSKVTAGRRVVFAEAFYAFAGGRPAPRLPVRFEWQVEGFEGGTVIVHEGVTDHEGRAADSLQVPAEATRGSVRFHYHEQGADYAPSAGQEFDFGAPGP